MTVLRQVLPSLAALFVLNVATFADDAGGEVRAFHEADLAPVAGVTQSEIDAGRIPGAVIVIGTKDKILYRRAFGNRTLTPKAAPMTVDTVFDLASLTKVVATTPAVMQLIGQGKLDLEAQVVRYWPEFGANGKDGTTLRHLLTHYSGLRADLDLSREWSGYETAMAMIVAETPVAPAGTRYLYSDLNFEILGELVRRITGSTLDRYAREHVFAPLGMNETGFLPSPELRDRIAPTQDLPGRVHWGDVHDATARWMGGVSGHAGLFSTADDLAIYARTLVNGGIEAGVRILDRDLVAAMTARQSPPAGSRARGLGWDLGGPDGYTIAPSGTYGHLGFTGTMIWIDPGSGIYAIVLTNRVYPDGKGSADPLRRRILELLAGILHPQSPK